MTFASASPDTNSWPNDHDATPCACPAPFTVTVRTVISLFREKNVGAYCDAHADAVHI
jgi:hypothetical protein